MTELTLTGIKPTGGIHLGNYFGTIRQMVDLQEQGNLVMFLADLHALTDFSDDNKRHSAETFARMSYDTIRAYIALGIDPKRTIIYRQSEFPQIAELTWIFSCLLKHQFLTIGHAYKDAQQREEQVGLGIFMYPVLMAADILLPGAEIVPVGKDQIQHVEITREIARKFNLLTGTQYFKEPQEKVIEETAVVPGIDGEKMSKSKNNTLSIFGSEDTVRKKISAIVTDSTPAGSPIPADDCIICTYLKLLMSSEEYGDVENKCLNGSITYQELKDLLADTYFAYFKTQRKRYAAMEKDTAYIDRVIGRHRKKVDTMLTGRLNDIRNLLGLAVHNRGLFG